MHGRFVLFHVPGECPIQWHRKKHHKELHSGITVLTPEDSFPPPNQIRTLDIIALYHHFTINYAVPYGLLVDPGDCYRNMEQITAV